MSLPQLINSATIPLHMGESFTEYPIILSRSKDAEGDYEYGDDGEYQPKRRRRTSDKANGSSSSIFSILKDQRQLGAALLGIGVILTFLGMMLLFERNLLRLGNISFISGVFLLIGPNRVTSFFMKETRIQATIITALGIILVFWGKPRLGIILEIFGLLNLFGNMFPMLLAVGRNIPIVGDVISAFDSKDSSTNKKKGKKTGTEYSRSSSSNSSYDDDDSTYDDYNINRNKYGAKPTGKNSRYNPEF